MEICDGKCVCVVATDRRLLRSHCLAQGFMHDVLAMLFDDFLEIRLGGVVFNDDSITDFEATVFSQCLYCVY